MSTRTVTIHTVDRGDVTIPEPGWCVGEHSFEPYRVDIEHAGADIPLMVPTACHGQVPTLTASIVQRPFSPTDSRTLVSVELDQFHEFDPAGLDAVAAALVEHAATLRKLARELTVLQEVGE